MNLLIVEDDAEISGMLKDYLQTEGFDVAAAYDGQTGYELFQTGHFDLVLLDLMLPAVSGMDLMKKIRQESIVPIIIMSAKDTDSDKTLGLGLGADDYITKPFSVTELLAKIKANIRRATQYLPVQPRKENCLLTAGSLILNTETYTVTKAGKKVELTAKEYAILKLLLENPRKVFTKAQLYARIWEDDYLCDENAVNVHISRLRNKIEEDSKKPVYIQTVWGIGYKFGNLEE